jgi:hypothetical protein
MSSQPPDARGDESREARAPSAGSGSAKSAQTRAASAGRETRWPRWRKSMFVGALILLASAIADAALDDFPRAVYVPVFFVGYIFLAYGFFLAMNARREAEKSKKK